MDRVEYHPQFWSEQIHTPMVLGAEPDFTQYYTWLGSGKFSFFAIQRFSGTHHQLPAREIHKYILYDNFDEILCSLETNYQKERFKVNVKVTNDIIVSRTEEQTIEFVFEIMYRLVQEMKLGIYKKSHYKNQLDDLYTAQQNMLRSVNIAGSEFEYIREKIDILNKQMNAEFERIIMFVEGGETVTQSLRDFHSHEQEPLEALEETIDEEQEFANIESHLERTSKTLKLSRVAIKNLPKSVSNKFVLPLDAMKEGDLDKFKGLIQQPFSFLEYNGSKFSIDFTIPPKDGQGYMDSQHNTALKEYFRQYQSIVTDMERRKKLRNDRMIKLNKVCNKLDEQVDYLKAEFEKKVERYGNDKYLKFVGSRTVNNLTKIREAQKTARTKIFTLKNKKLYTDPKAFFKRMLKLYLGETGKDILKDLKALGYTGKKDAEIGIEYFLFLLSVVEGNSGYNSPVLPLVDNKTFNKGYDEIDMIKVIAGHMFIHTVSISKDGAKLTPPKTRMVKE
jgi:hypothetical protein